LYGTGIDAIVGSEGSRKYYILCGNSSGNNFGVTADGHVYAYAGKIGGWTITESNLNNGNIIISSTGSINC
jgi:hypothetical protein